MCKNKMLHSAYKYSPNVEAMNSSSARSRFNLKHSSSVWVTPKIVELLSRHLQSLLHVCTIPNYPVLPEARQVHVQIVVNGIYNVGFLGSTLLGVYLLSRSLADARNLFHRLQLRYASPWNWMIKGFTMTGRFHYALLFYFKMLGYGASPDKYTFPYVMKACGSLKSLRLGNLVHDTIRSMGLEADLFVGSSLIEFYAGSGCFRSARLLFDKMRHRDDVLWTVMLGAYGRCGDIDSALLLFKEMIDTEMRPTSATSSCILSICASEKVIRSGTQLHGLLSGHGLTMDHMVAYSLLSMYVKCECFVDARKVLHALLKTDPFAWNLMLAGYVQNGLDCEAMCLLTSMTYSGLKPSSITLTSLLPSVAQSGSLKHGKEIQGFIVRHELPLDMYLKSALIDVYSKCRNMGMGCKIFNQNTAADMVVYTAMVSGYLLNGLNSRALSMFRQLLEKQLRPNEVTLASVIPACTGLDAFQLGKELHCYVLKNRQDSGCYVGSALTDMYAKCGRLDLAHRFFERLPKKDKDSVCWDTMIVSFAQNGMPKRAIELFREMAMEGAKCDCMSITAALSACSNLPSLQYGKQIHGFLTKNLPSCDISAEKALTDLYSNCGNLNLARRVFHMSQWKHGVVSWNSIIAAYGSHGCLEESLQLFTEMVSEKVQPDHITFLSLMSVCSHTDRVDEGICYFNSMMNSYGIPPKMEHYACVVELLGRAGRVGEAVELINNMPFRPDASIWGSLLGACRCHGNVKLAELASRHLFELDPQNSGYYVLLANTHADAGQWEGASNIRSLMKERGVQKVPGYSSIEFNNTPIHVCY